MDKTRTSRPEHIGIGLIIEAEWNVHRRSNPVDDAFKGLVASIANGGMIHRIAVRRHPDDANKYEVIDGHRRLEAIKALGWTDVPCEVLEGITDADAQAAQITANIQRMANDPLLEAEAIERLQRAGKTREQIAAIIGADERYVTRRARLINLTDAWREWLDRNDADADIMEKVAAYERSLQDEVFEEMDLADEDNDGDVSEDDIERAFERRLHELDKHCPFDTRQCASCPRNTANHGYLFPTGETARCEDGECFDRKWNAAVDAEIERLRADGKEPKEVRNKWDIPDSWNATPNPTKQNDIPFVYEESGRRVIAWSHKRVDNRPAAPARTKAEIETEKRVKREHREWAKNRSTAFDKIRNLLKREGAAEKVAAEMVDAPGFRARYIEKTADGFRRWANDYDCEDIYRVLESEGLASVGCDELTPEEVKALVTEDPAKAGEADGEEVSE